MAYYNYFSYVLIAPALLLNYIIANLSTFNYFCINLYDIEIKYTYLKIKLSLNIKIYHSLKSRECYIN